MMTAKEVFSAFLILFSVIDILGSTPVVISMKKKGKIIESGKATLVAGVLMIAFLYLGESILHLFGVDVNSFAIAGALVILFIGIEMILGITLFKDEDDSNNSTVVPLAFPLIAGAGTLTTILSIKTEFSNWSILTAIVLNMIVVYLVLRFSDPISKRLGNNGAAVLRKVFGIILLAIAIKLFKSNLAFLG